MQHHTAGEFAKPKNINALRVAAFWCGAAGGILSPAVEDLCGKSTAIVVLPTPGQAAETGSARVAIVTLMFTMECYTRQMTSLVLPPIDVPSGSPRSPECIDQQCSIDLAHEPVFNGRRILIMRFFVRDGCRSLRN
jgi:hypothetical protein